MSSQETATNSDSEITCVVCFKVVDYYSVGGCDHPVCAECSTRLRVLCRQYECPICRQDMPSVLFCKTVDIHRDKDAAYEKAPYVDNKNGIWFESTEILEAYNDLLDFACTKCSKTQHFINFLQLKDHLRRLHEHYYCDLCVEHLRIFPWERKSYTRADLAHHRRKGDPDDKSHRGHPLCEFCDVRYMDSDDLFRHLRRDHLFCHFCDSDGLHQYYASYESLREHFKSEHYLCEEGNCVNEKFTSVFRSEIDIKAHRASVHAKQLGKVATKQARTLALEFTLRPRPRVRVNSHLSSYPCNTLCVRTPYGDEDLMPNFDEIPEPSKPKVALCDEDFPSLGAPSRTTSPPLRPNSSGGGNLSARYNARSQKSLARTNQNFPALSSDSNTVRLSVNSSSVGPQDSLQTTTTTNAQNVSIHVNHRTDGAITTHISQNPPSTMKMKFPDGFPVLGYATLPQTQWVKQGPSKESRPKATQVAPAPVLPMRNSKTDFPHLSSSKPNPKLKKTSSVTVPVSNTWVTEQPEQKDAKVSKGKKKKSKGSANTTNSSSASEHTYATKTTSASDAKSNVAKKEPQNQSLLHEKQQPPKHNGVIKKRSELRIESLHISEPNESGNKNDFPPLGMSKPPPGIAVQAPPGFAANDLTFTSSSGQSYSILPPAHFTAPPNFPQRNQKLIESFMTSASSDNIVEFKTLSNLFRSGVYPPDEYYHHCKDVMKANFTKIFPELLVLLPDIEKQQELYAIHCMDAGNKKGLEVCATCGQVVATADLRSHLASHRMDNHFPALGAQELPSVWKKS